MAKDFGPAIRLSPTGVVERARAPTQRELEDLLSQLVEWQLAHAGQMPPELFVRLRQFVEWQILQRPWTRRQVQLMRWSFVREGLDRGKGWDGGAYEYAAIALEGTPARAGPEMMRKAYNEIQRNLPAAQRRPRTYRRRKRD